MNFPIISIIVPVYKTPVVLLKRFLKSVFGQTLPDIQLIAVNDASPDDCPRILDAAAANDDRMTVVHRSVNGRAGMARNDGLKLAEGRYVHFADADDFLRPDMCAKLAGIADRCGADIVRTSFTTSDLKGKCLSRQRLPDRIWDLTRPRHRAMAYHDLTFALWDKLFRREVIVPLHFEQYEANIGEDTLFNVAALCRSRKIAMTSYAGYDYTVHPASATGRAVKGMSYLRTLAESGKRIRQTIEQEDGSREGEQFADLIDLKRFATGCGWIAENPDFRKKGELWKCWRKHFYKDLYPRIYYRKFLAAWVMGVAALCGPHTAYPLIWGACRIADPFFLDRRLKDKLN